MKQVGSAWGIEIEPHILKEYDFQVLDFKKIKSVTKLKTQFGDFALKKTSITYHQANHMNNILQFLQSENFPAPVIIPSKYGENFISYSKELIYVTKWINGSNISLNYNPHLLMIISSMAQLHKLGLSYSNYKSGFPTLDEIKIRQIWQERINWLKKYYKKLKKNNYNSTFEHLYLTYIPFIKDWAEGALENLNEWILQYQGISNSRKTISHGRIHHRNTLIIPEEKIFLLDFDHVSIDTPVRDIAYFIRHYILSKEYRNWAKEWLETYEVIMPLTKPEKKLLAISLLFPERLLTLAKKYDEKLTVDTEEIYLKKLQIRWDQMKEINWFIDQYQMLND